VQLGLLMFLLLGRPLALVTTGLTNWLNGLSGTSAILLGIILGLMMCFDLGGPVNKAAYAFATAGLASPTPAALQVMAAVMAAGMVPPLAMALASTVRPGLFTEPERENGRAAWLLGASFISEGAIPFAAADPLRVIPSMMAGGAVTGALIMAFSVTLRAPHGGIWVVGLIGKPGLYLIAIAAGVLVGFGGGSGHTTVKVLGVAVPMATAIADVAAARRDYLDESGGRYVHVIADGSMTSSGDIAKALAIGADAVMVGSPLARAAEAPGHGYHWGSEANHTELPRGARVRVGTIGTLQQILHGPSTVPDGSMNLMGALRRTMATAGYSDLKEFQRVEVVVADSGLPRPQR